MCDMVVSASGSNIQIPCGRFCRFVMQSNIFWAWAAVRPTKPRKARQGVLCRPAGLCMA